MLHVTVEGFLVTCGVTVCLQVALASGGWCLSGDEAGSVRPAEAVGRNCRGCECAAGREHRRPQQGAGGDQCPFLPTVPHSLSSGLWRQSLTAARVSVRALAGLQGPAQHPGQKVKVSTE